MSLPEIINHYYRDDKELTYEEWRALFEEDLDKEAEGSTWNIRSVVYTDYSNGRDCNLNGHEYKNRIDRIFNAAKDLLEDMIEDGKSYELIKAIESLSEGEAQMFVQHIERVKKKDQKFILEDDEDCY